MTTLKVVGNPKHRRYTPRTKALAVGIAAAQGVTEAEVQTGIPKTTIHYWLRQPEFAPLRTTAREIVAEDFWVGVQVGIEEVSKGLRNPDISLRDKALALGVVYDRFALLTGLPTTRSETRDITEKLDDHERDALADAIDAWLQERVDARP